MLEAFRTIHTLLKSKQKKEVKLSNVRWKVSLPPSALVCVTKGHCDSGRGVRCVSSLCVVPPQLTFASCRELPGNITGVETNYSHKSTIRNRSLNRKLTWKMTGETSPNPGTSSLSTIWWGKNNVDLITSDKQLAKKKKKSMKNYWEDSMKCGFTSTIIHSKLL